MVELNHGKIWVESEPNLGSKFFVELPKAKPIS
jgi:signal transduction histidine kinase